MCSPDEGEEDKDNGEGAEDFVLPDIERLAQLGQFITEALDLELEVGVAGGVVANSLCDVEIILRVCLSGKLRLWVSKEVRNRTGKALLALRILPRARA